jgi:hypothetical protein
MKTGTANEEILAKMAECAKAVIVRWRDLSMSMKMPKIHAYKITCCGKRHFTFESGTLLKTSSNRRTRLEEQKTIGQET